MRVPVVCAVLAIAVASGGIHPSAAAARQAAENVWPYLAPLLHATALAGR